MCAIVDANVTFEVFGRKRTEAGRKFRDWLDGGRGTLAVSGRNLDELAQNGNFQRWFLEARRRPGRVRQISRAQIEARQDELRRSGPFRSDDRHVLALALASGARLLYSNDRRLNVDFSNPGVIRRPRGRVCTTLESGSFRPEHQELLEAKNLCGGARNRPRTKPPVGRAGLP